MSETEIKDTNVYNEDLLLIFIMNVKLLYSELFGFLYYNIRDQMLQLFLNFPKSRGKATLENVAGV